MYDALYKDLRKWRACTRLANLTGFTETNLPVWSAIRPNATSGSSTAGKGLTDEQSIYSALFECYELTCAEKLKPKGICSREQVHNKFLFHPNDLYNNSVQYCEGVEVTTGNIVKVAYDCLCMNTTRKFNAYRCSTIGTGAGWSEEQAFNAAYRELIERYSISQCAHRKSWMHIIYNANAKDIWDEELQHVLDICWTNKYQILVQNNEIVENWSCFSVRLIANSEQGLMVGTGHGCHKRSSKALLQAILEANQGICIAASGIRDDMPKSTYVVSRSQQNLWEEKISQVAKLTIENLLTTSNRHDNGKQSASKLGKNLILYKFPKLAENDSYNCLKLLFQL